MKQEKKWPKFIELQYYDENSGKIMGFSGFMNDSAMMLEVLFRYKITEPNLLRWMVNDTLLNNEGISKMFSLYEKYQKEIGEKYEKWETVNQKTKGTDSGSESQS